MTDMSDESPRSWLEDLHLAAVFLTRLKLPPLKRAGELAPAMRLFPLVGAGIGLAAGLVYVFLLWLELPTPVAALMAIGTMILLTGGLHEDGLADTADGFGARAERERKLEIMRDSRTGSFGVLALILAVGLRAGALAALGPWDGLAALIASESLSRALQPWLMSLGEPARADGLAQGAGRPSREATTTALLWGALFVFLPLGPKAGILAILLAAGAVWLMHRLSRDQIGGYTGDTIGAAQQAAAIAVLLAVLLAL